MAPRVSRVSLLAARLAAVEARLRRLEPPDAGAPRPASSSTAGRTWVLDGLKRRAAPAPKRGRSGGRVAFAGIVYATDESHYQWLGERELAPLFEQPWEDWAATFESLGHGVRLELLRALARGAQDVNALGALPGMRTYHHLRVLTAAGWVRQLQRNQYAIVPDRVVALMVMIAAASGPHPPDSPHDLPPRPRRKTTRSS
jgi:DNA-binding transcriptional ArsR family regulator